MSETSIIAIILSLIAVGGTIGGTWLGQLLERNSETRKWRREHCLEAYTEALISSIKFSSEAQYLYIIECGTTPERAEQVVIVQELSIEVYHLTDKLLLVAPSEVYEKFRDLALYCGKELAIKSMKCPKLAKSEWDIVRDDFTALLADCQFAARNDLGLFPKRYRIKGFKDYKKSIEELNEELSKGTISHEQKKQRLKELNMKLKKGKKEWDKQDNQARKNR